MVHLKHSWVEPSLMTRKTRQFSEVKTIGETCFWLERRPEEEGRSVIVMRTPQGTCHDMIEPGYDVGTSVHEYGGGAWTVRKVTSGWDVIFSDRKKGGVWSCVNGTMTRLWRDTEKQDDLVYHYAGFCFHPLKDEVYCVRECQSKGAEGSVLLSLTPEDGSLVRQTGSDFYASPCLSSDGQFLAWVEWQNPSMPWDETQFCIMSLKTGQKWCFTSHNEAVSFIEPQWYKNRLYILSDQKRNDEAERFWSPVYYEWNGTEWLFHDLPSPHCEIGLPLWVFGQSSYCMEKDGSLLARGLREGVSCLVRYESQKGWKDIPTSARPEMVPSPLEKTGCYCWIDVPDDKPPALAMGSLNGDYDRFRLAWTLPDGITHEDIAKPESLVFPSEDKELPVRGFFYPPAQGKNCYPVKMPPPLVVLVHGGPTGQAGTGFSFKVQWWATRGFAVLDVNYRGSTGFGRKYRDALKGQWGVADVQDCCLAVKSLIHDGRVDPRCCFIRGSSAGGLTVLSALAMSSLFRAGTVLYGVTDLKGLVEQTHRFEAYYFDHLIGPLPEAEALYEERSPINWPEKLTKPVLFFHGEQDKVVPMKLAEAMAKKMKHAVFHSFPGEGHGFRSPAVIAESLEREFSFYESLFSQENG